MMKPIHIVFSALLSIVYAGTVFAENSANPVYNVRGVKIDYHPPAQASPSLDSTTRTNIIEQALSLAGTHYQYGGDNPETGFDCSGFVQYVYQQAADISLPRTAAQMSQFGTSIKQTALQDGDLVFFNTNQQANSHVGIYIGKNQMIHAPSTGKSVSITKLDNSYWKSRLNGAIRITAP